MKGKQDFLTEKTSLNNYCLSVGLSKSPLLPLSSTNELVCVFFTAIAHNPSGTDKN